jgi:hypothetical protein
VKRVPRYFFACEACNKPYQRICAPVEAKQEQACPACSKPLKRTPKPANTMVLETLDNGLMARKLERLADAERIFAERAANDPRNKDPIHD